MQFNNLSVVEFNNIVKNIFDYEEMLYNCAVVGEVSSFKITNNVAYFTIKDEYAVLSCVQFSPEKEYRIGEKVKVVGRPNYYVKGGKLNFNVNFITSFGEGDIYKKFLELKERLNKEGFYINKKGLPQNVCNIGVVTSSKGAVIKDIISVAKRRNPNINIYVYPVKVQGEGADKEIVKGVEYFNLQNKIDVIIIARGGGSNEDLSPFNCESVARACFVCEKVIISAVGHETDFTLIDLVADIRASTPSVAAEIAVKEAKSQINSLKLLKFKLDNCVKNALQNRTMQLNFSLEKINKSIQNKFLKKQMYLQKLKSNLNYLIKIKAENLAHKLENLNYQLKLQNPNFLLNKGFVVVEKERNRVKGIEELKIDDELIINFINGKVKTKVIGVDKK